MPIDGLSFELWYFFPPYSVNLVYKVKFPNFYQASLIKLAKKRAKILTQQLTQRAPSFLFEIFARF